MYMETPPVALLPGERFVKPEKPFNRIILMQPAFLRSHYLRIILSTQKLLLFKVSSKTSDVPL